MEVTEDSPLSETTGVEREEADLKDNGHETPRRQRGPRFRASTIADLKSTDSTCSSSSATWNDVRFELKHRARMGAT